MLALIDSLAELLATGLHEQDPAEHARRLKALIDGARSALGTDPFANLDAEDAARHARLLAAHAVAITRVSSADVSVVRRLADSPMLTDEERAAAARLATHTAITLGDERP